MSSTCLGVQTSEIQRPRNSQPHHFAITQADCWIPPEWITLRACPEDSAATAVGPTAAVRLAGTVETRRTPYSTHRARPLGAKRVLRSGLPHNVPYSNLSLEESAAWRLPTLNHLEYHFFSAVAVCHHTLQDGIVFSPPCHALLRIAGNHHYLWYLAVASLRSLRLVRLPDPSLSPFPITRFLLSRSPRI
jgi:hypothetical protein